MHEFIVALNKLKDQVRFLTFQVESLTKSPFQQLNRKYLDTEDACSVLHVSKRTLYKMRFRGELPFIKMHRKIIYQASDIQQYLESKLKKAI